MRVIVQQVWRAWFKGGLCGRVSPDPPTLAWNPFTGEARYPFAEVLPPGHFCPFLTWQRIQKRRKPLASPRLPHRPLLEPFSYGRPHFHSHLFSLHGQAGIKRFGSSFWGRLSPPLEFWELNSTSLKVPQVGTLLLRYFNLFLRTSCLPRGLSVLGSPQYLNPQLLRRGPELTRALGATS